MLKVYDILMCLTRWFALAIAPEESQPVTGKTMRYLQGQSRASETALITAAKLDRSRPTVWLHADSLGEYAIARPIISELRKTADCTRLATFSSSGAYESASLSGKDLDGVLYLPFDTRANASAFLDSVRPDCAVFIATGDCHNYLRQLKERAIPSLLVSDVIVDDSPCFHPLYGRLYL